MRKKTKHLFKPVIKDARHVEKLIPRRLEDMKMIERLASTMAV